MTLTHFATSRRVKITRKRTAQRLVELYALDQYILHIGTGQNALSGTALLQRLQGRFPVTVELQDTDVEQVTREVVLKKKPTAEVGLCRPLDTVCRTQVGVEQEILSPSPDPHPRRVRVARPGLGPH